MAKVITKIYTVYEFDELDDDTQELVIDKLSDINTGYGWWDCLLDDAKDVGLIIESFSIGRDNYCKGDFDVDVADCAEKIIKNHGDCCDTWQTATNYLAEHTELIKDHSDGVRTDEVAEDNQYEYEQEAESMDKEFLRDILEDYKNCLRKEHEYLSSREAIIETIEANGYEFTKDGSID